MATKEKHVEVAQRYLKKRNARRAISEYQKALKIDPSDIRLRLRLGDLLLQERRSDEAVEMLEAVADLYEDRGFLLKAVSVYKRILQIRGDEPADHEHLAACYERLGQIPEAVGELRESAKIYGTKGERIPRLRTIQRILDHDARNLRGRLRLAEGFSNAGMVQEAAKELRKLVRELERNEHWDAFVQVAERLLHHEVRDLDIAKRLARHYLKGGEPQTALPKLQACYKASPVDVEILGLLADAFNQLGQVQKAIAVLKKKASIYEQNGLSAERDEVLRQILLLNPDETQIRRDLGQIEKPDGAIDGRDLEIVEVSDEEVDALMSEIRQAEADGELSVGELFDEPDGDEVPDIRSARVPIVEAGSAPGSAPAQEKERGAGEVFISKVPAAGSEVPVAGSEGPPAAEVAVSTGDEEPSVITSVDDATLGEMGFETELDRTAVEDIESILAEIEARECGGVEEEEIEVVVEIEEVAPEPSAGTRPGFVDEPPAAGFEAALAAEGEGEDLVVELEPEDLVSAEPTFSGGLEERLDADWQRVLSSPVIRAPRDAGTTPSITLDDAILEPGFENELGEPTLLDARVPVEVTEMPEAPELEPVDLHAAPFPPRSPDRGSDRTSERALDLSPDLKELDFYIESGLVDEAKALWERLRARHPSHPDLDRRSFFFE